MLRVLRSTMQVMSVVIVSALLFAACGGGGGGVGAPATPPVTLRSIAVTPSSPPSLALNFDQQFTATGTYSDNSTQNLTTSVSWSSSSAVVATVGAGTGLATPAGGASSGQTTVITATSGGLTASSTLTLAPTATLSSIAVTPQNRSVSTSSTLQLAVVGTYSNGRTKDATSLATWSSGTPGVAAVNASTGLVTPAGTIGQSAVITAAVSGVSSATTTVRLAGPTFSLATSPTDPLTAQQWGLRNTGQNGYADNVGTANTGTLGTDINVNPVFSNYGYTGWGVIVGVVDTGLEIAHEDLSANVVLGGSWNFVNSTTNPTTTATTGDHGTSVSGLIAMAHNSVGGIGVAPNVQLKGFNYLAPTLTQTSAIAIAALGGSSASPNSSDVAIFNQSYGTSNTSDFLVTSTVEDQYASGASTLRGGKGALYVKSAGNGFAALGSASCSAANSIGVSCQNANFDPYNTLPYNIVMAALNAKGKKSSYSTAGSAIWASTPGGEFGKNASVSSGSGVSFDPAMVTTDQAGCTNGYSRTSVNTSLFNNGSSANSGCNYTNGFNGTSSAAPMMTGVIAQILEANPALTWREVKDILARTAVQVDSSKAAITVALGNGNYVAEQAWITNAAGFKFHNWYGFGAVDANAAVAMATTYVSGSLGTFANTVWTSSSLSSVIADNSVTGVSVPLTVPKVGASGKVETVQIKVTTVNNSSGYSGDMGIELTSPSGTKSILKNIKDGFASTNLAGMVLSSNAFYGENNTGTWTVKVVDGWSIGTQTLTNVQIRVYGH